MSEDKVVFLAFSTDKVGAESISVHSCKVCRNKTFILIDRGPQEYPVLNCAACRSQIGEIGWAHDAS